MVDLTIDYDAFLPRAFPFFVTHNHIINQKTYAVKALLLNQLGRMCEQNLEIDYYFLHLNTDLLFFFIIHLSVCHYHKTRITITQ
jgi:hypothetical protein